MKIKILLLFLFIPFESFSQKNGEIKRFDNNGNWIGSSYYTNDKLDSIGNFEDDLFVCNEFKEGFNITRYYFKNKLVGKKMNYYESEKIIEIYCRWIFSDKRFHCDTMFKGIKFKSTFIDTVLYPNRLILPPEKPIVLLSNMNDSDTGEIIIQTNNKNETIIINTSAKDSQKDDRIISLYEDEDIYLKSEYSKNDPNYGPIVTKFDQAPDFGSAKSLNYFISNKYFPDWEKMNLPISDYIILDGIIHVDGKFTDIKVVKKVNSIADYKAIYVASLLQFWNPATIKGKPVNARVQLRIEVKHE